MILESNLGESRFLSFWYTICTGQIFYNLYINCYQSKFNVPITITHLSNYCCKILETMVQLKRLQLKICVRLVSWLFLFRNEFSSILRLNRKTSLDQISRKLSFVIFIVYLTEALPFSHVKML